MLWCIYEGDTCKLFSIVWYVFSMYQIFHGLLTLTKLLNDNILNVLAKCTS